MRRLPSSSSRSLMTRRETMESTPYSTKDSPGSNSPSGSLSAFETTDFNQSRILGRRGSLGSAPPAPEAWETVSGLMPGFSAATGGGTSSGSSVGVVTVTSEERGSTPKAVWMAPRSPGAGSSRGCEWVNRVIRASMPAFSESGSVPVWDLHRESSSRSKVMPPSCHRGQLTEQTRGSWPWQASAKASMKPLAKA